MAGIKSLTYDDEKSTLTVVGEVDVVEIVAALRKAKHPAECQPCYIPIEDEYPGPCTIV
ncbi:late cornified envelope-like proline-rich protein 1 [Panicum miliaceum]|uniref:Late cornified envelope-like proline-rich protein 1 n=1 Tax=Panicum miliaceum TaxID=4540 RepID=A0A3L6R2V0_PANMI|nr:late cornified envelope-like proline-rich protein 1 [Panicum miliaceum]